MTKALQWFADADGVHRLKENAAENLPSRAVADLFVSRFLWTVFTACAPYRTVYGQADSIEEAQAAAEQAVKEMDGDL